MTLLLELLRYNDVFATSIAIAGNILLIYLILSVNKNNVIKMNIILLPNCIIDLLTAIFIFIEQPQAFNIENQTYLVMGSGMTIKWFHAPSVILWFCGSFLILTMNAACIPFYLRYLVICKNVEISLRKIILPYFILFISFIFFFIIISWVYPYGSEHYEKSAAALNNSFWLDEYPNGASFIAANNDELPFFVMGGAIGITSALSYTLVIYFSIKITKTLKTHVSSFSSPKILSKQLHKALTIQALGPFLIANVPAYVFLSLFFLKVQDIRILLSFSFFFGWIPVINPMEAIIIITPYQQKVKELIRLSKTSAILFSTIPNEINKNSKRNPTGLEDASINIL